MKNREANPEIENKNILNHIHNFQIDLDVNYENIKCAILENDYLFKERPKLNLSISSNNNSKNAKNTIFIQPFRKKNSLEYLESNFKECVKEKRYAEAIDSLLNLSNLNPSDNFNHYLLGRLYYDFGMHIKDNSYDNRRTREIHRSYIEESELHFKKYISKEANDSAAYKGLGEAYVELDKPFEAVDMFNLSIKINPSHLETYLNRAEAYRLAGLKIRPHSEVDYLDMYEKSIKDTLYFLKFYPMNIRAQTELMWAYHEVGCFKEADNIENKINEIKNGKN